jgi:ribosome-associated protein
MDQEIAISTPYIRLDQLLKLADIVGSGGDAKYLITNGFVYYNSEVMLLRGKKVYPNDRVKVEFEGNTYSLIVRSE